MLTLQLVLLPLAFATRGHELAGQWVGRMEPKGLSAAVELTLEFAGDAPRARLKLTSGPRSFEPEIRALRVSAESLSFSTDVEGAQVEFAAGLDGGLLVGTVQAFEHGELLCEGPWGLARERDLPRLLAQLDAGGIAIDAKTQDEVIERALALLRERYLSADGAAKAEARVREHQKAGVFRECRAAGRFAETLSRDLADAAGDRHLRVRYESQPVVEPSESDETAAERELARADAAAIGFGIGRVEVLDLNVGYLALNRLVRADLAGDALAAAIGELAATDAMIVDLRECGGGDPVMVALVASWFFEGRTRRLFDLQRRRAEDCSQLWTAAWLPRERYTKPVYILVATRTFSASECLAYVLKDTGRATIVGETTGGGAHSGQTFPLGEHFSLFVPLSRTVSAASGGNWEGVGVVPDVACRAVDALDVALARAREQLGRAPERK